MIYRTMNIDVSGACTGKKSDIQTQLVAYLPSNSEKIEPNKKRKTVLVLPGGGYAFVSPRESEPVALRLMSAGFNAFVLNYSVAPATFPTSICEVATAIALIRENAKEWNVDTDCIVVGGFSAGGHLAGSIGTLWHTDFLEEQTGLKKEQYKPNGLMLAYPVFSSEHQHVASFENLLGGKGVEKYADLVALEKNITKNMPKSFIWHTFDDATVPMENSLVIASAMKKQGVPFELHIFPSGIHGLSLANETTAGKAEENKPDVAVWFDMFITWLENL